MNKPEVSEKLTKTYENLSNDGKELLENFSDEHSPSPPDSPPLLDKKELKENIDAHGFPYCTDISKYERIEKIGQGTYGEVFKARERANPSNIVAMKRILTKNENLGFPKSAIREIKLLRKLDHKNVIRLIDICYEKGQSSSDETIQSNTIYLIFELCEHDLAGLISNTDVEFTLAHKKSIVKQLLEALFYLHNNQVIHRDIKSSNIFMTSQGVLKLGDFGLARGVNVIKPKVYTNRVVTLWYRAPELLLGAKRYACAVDLWSVGCLMAELWTRCPILQGDTEQGQLILITELCGSITPEVWPKVVDLPLYHQLILPAGLPRRVKERLRPNVGDPFAIDLMDKLLILDPETRCDTTSAIDHDLFWNDPLPCDPSTMLSKYTESMYAYNRCQQAADQSETAVASTSKSPVDAGFNNRKV